MAALSLLVQVAGLCVGIYIAFSRSVVQGILLVVVVEVLHFAVEKLSNLLMLLHQRRLSGEQLHALRLYGESSGMFGATPAAWKTIATACGLVYFCLAVTVIWLFLRS